MVLLRGLEAKKLEEIVGAAPKKVREELYRRAGVKGRPNPYSLKSDGGARAEKLKAKLDEGTDPGREVEEEILRAYFYARRRLLADALNHLGVKNNEGLTDQDLDFMQELEPEKVASLEKALSAHDPDDVRLYLQMMGVPRAA